MPAKSVFQRMHNRLLARLGERAFLRGTEEIQVNIEYGVVVNYDIGDDKYVQSEFAATVDVANIKTMYAPQVGDTLNVGGSVNPDGTLNADGTQYVLDALAADNGYMTRYVLRR